MKVIKFTLDDHCKVIERLWKDTEQWEDCWLWTGFTVGGYGRVTIGKINQSVHRLSAMVFHGLDINNSEILVLHKYQCPNKNCWCPDHIWPGTQRENNTDQVISGTHYNHNRFAYRTQCSNGHEYTEQNTLFVDGRRRCKLCRRNRVNKWRHKNRNQVT